MRKTDMITCTSTAAGRASAFNIQPDLTSHINPTDYVIICYLRHFLLYNYHLLDDEALVALEFFILLPHAIQNGRILHILSDEES
jgi:hypothetical protein